MYITIEKIIKSHSTKRILTQSKSLQTWKNQNRSWFSTDLTTNELCRAEGRSAHPPKKSSKSNNSIDAQEGKAHACTSERTSEQANVLSLALFESN